MWTLDTAHPTMFLGGISCPLLTTPSFFLSFFLCFFNLQSSLTFRDGFISKTPMKNKPTNN